MAIRFRKSIKIAPGVKLNIGKKSASVSVGVKGFRKSFSTTGRQTTTVGIPGTGLYSSETKRIAAVHKKKDKKKKKGFFKKLFDLSDIKESVQGLANIASNELGAPKLHSTPHTEDLKGSNFKEVLEFRVRSWGMHLENIKQWQKENAMDSWAHANYAQKPIYHYTWMSDVPCTFIEEKDNQYDKYAILVCVDDKILGYVPSPENKRYRKEILKKGVAKVDIHGGDRKYKDEYGDIIKEEDDPVVDLKVYLK